MKETKLLRDFMETLWARKGGDGLSAIRLRVEQGDELHVKRSVSPHTIRVRYYVAGPGDESVKDLEVVLLITETNEWLPIAFYRANRGRHIYAQVDDNTGEMTPIDLINQRACADYCDGWSFQLRAQGWLEEGVVV